MDKKITKATKVLMKTRKTLEDKKNWMQGDFHNYPDEDDGEPPQYCLLGAMGLDGLILEDDIHVAEAVNHLVCSMSKDFDKKSHGMVSVAVKHMKEIEEDPYMDRYERESRQEYICDAVASYNDHGGRRHSDIIRLLDRAIQRSMSK